MPSQRQPQRSGGRHVGRRLIAKGATFALRAAALPLMHRALRAYANEGAGGAGLSMGQQQKGGNRRLQQQQQQQYEEQEDAEAAEQRSLRRAQWLSAVARSRNTRLGSGNGRSAREGNASVLPPLYSQNSFGETSALQRQGSSHYHDGAVTPPLTPRSSSKAQASQPSSCTKSPAGMRGGEEGGGGQGRSMEGGRNLPPHVHSFPTLLSASGQESWSEGLLLAGVEWEGRREAARRSSYRRARSSLQFGGPSLVVEGVPMTPEPSLSHRFSAMSSTSGKDIGSTDGFSFGADEILERQGVRGGGKQDGVLQGTGGKRGTASNSSNSNSSAVAQGKQRLTLSEMGMLHGAW